MNRGAVLFVMSMLFTAVFNTVGAEPNKLSYNSD
jgi:hypothetical protein